MKMAAISEKENALTLPVQQEHLRGLPLQALSLVHHQQVRCWLQRWLLLAWLLQTKTQALEAAECRIAHIVEGASC